MDQNRARTDSQNQSTDRHEHTFVIDFTADHKVDEAELYQVLGKISFVKPGSQRARRIWYAR